ETRARHELRLEEIVRVAPVGRPALSFGLGMAAIAALLPAFLLLAPSSRWEPTGLVIALGAISLVSYASALALQRPLMLDSVFIAALLAAVFLGPLPAACTWAGTEVFAWLVESHRPAAAFASVASYGWSVLAGAVLLDWLLPGWPGAPGGVL